MTRIRHAFTVDVEEHFQVHALEAMVKREGWEQHPSRVEGATERLLEILDEGRARATFFVLGWVARRQPALVRRIVDLGHEVASHGMNHRKIRELGPHGFRRDVQTSKAVLEDIAGVRVLGYRAPGFSLRDDHSWALEVLADEGYVYDSSTMPARRPSIVPPDRPCHPHVIETASGPLLELPVTPVRRAGVTLPAGGGAYFRHLPYGLTRAALTDAAARGEPAVFYIHPWEVDPAQPRLPASPVTRLRHYGRLSRTPARLRRLVDEFEFDCVRGIYPRLAERVAGSAGSGAGREAPDS